MEALILTDPFLPRFQFCQKFQIFDWFHILKMLTGSTLHQCYLLVHLQVEYHLAENSLHSDIKGV